MKRKFWSYYTLLLKISVCHAFLRYFPVVIHDYIPGVIIGKISRYYPGVKICNFIVDLLFAQVNIKSMKRPRSLTEAELEAQPAEAEPINAEPINNVQSLNIDPGSMDKINNLVQKETNLSKAGVTRYKYMLVIAEALEATKMGDVIDEQGNVKREMIPDIARRQWAAEQAARLYGDMIERKEIEHDLGDKTLERFQRLSVNELKARAAEIIAGKPQGRLPPIDV